ncbi:MAG: prealbumin-like fold domain-containing protein, partial [Nitrososphaera sp.]|nr:prealbumin-like fold domain-containing protein [Nitrososphaera sp.]
MPGSPLITAFSSGNAPAGYASNSSITDWLTIVTISADDGTLLENATYLLVPNPVTRSGNITVRDNGGEDLNIAFGLISFARAIEGNYTVTQMLPPPGYVKDSVPKIVTVTAEQPATVTFVNERTSDRGAASSKSITYTAKFQCGTIEGGEGPLRPGRYDTDISILNSEPTSVKILWNAIVDDGLATNAILRTLEPEMSTDIVCKDLYQLIRPGGDFTDGFVVIRVQLGGALGSLASDDGVATIDESSTGVIDPLEVQVFYTANALATLPHPVYVDKIIFSVQSDPSGKIPPSMIKKPLDLTVESSLNEISDPEAKVRNAISAQYGLSSEELN